ncbi:unnamed protein product [Rotaria sp. Silwood1]|nr:unnamed protein product [Rotaria sp. Silwood1]CAF4604701.1 unnamed protein product [Rotaria sp. Silwood1]
MYFDCLYYEVSDLDIQRPTKTQNFKTNYQVIPYCIRPWSENEAYHEINEGNVLSRLTFEELRTKQVTIRDLLLWSAPLDLIERYDEYLDSPLHKSSRLDMFYNCSSLWFGTYCQYTFNLNYSFNKIVNNTFRTKNRLTISNMTCYIHLKCNRGSTDVCLDWREICDRKVDCIGNDVDEIGCFELELNECKENEFRCHNGICIPEEFMGEGSNYPDCLDGTDEDNRQIYHDIEQYSNYICIGQPGFWCEETDYAKRPRFFVCGDGERSDLDIFYNYTYILPTIQVCLNFRDVRIRESLYAYVEDSDLSYECWFFLQCSADYNLELDCNKLCDYNDEYACYINITNICQTSFVIFPQRPLLQGHVFFVYLTNKTIYYVVDNPSMFPDYVCYDVRKCPFLPSISILNINGTTCRTTEELGLRQFLDIINLFQGCLIVIENELKTNYSQSSSLFQCSGTTKYISKHRVLDGVHDCYKGADEIGIDTCQWNHKHRFKCSFENKCISDVQVRNAIKDCLGGEDEILYSSQRLLYQKLCNGFVHMSSVLIDGMNETDETHCDYWPCNNLYTRCDGAWNCLNGADELNCVLTNCPGDTHECVSPITKKIMCLPIHQAGNGIVDCLGSTDERTYCRLKHPKNYGSRYKCWNESLCIPTKHYCLDDICQHDNFDTCSKDVDDIIYRLDQDKKLQFPEYEHFMLERPQTNMSSLIMKRNFLLNPSQSMSDLETFFEQSNSLNKLITNQENTILNKQFGIDRIDTCKRGIGIYVGIPMTMHCLCPPSYYGDQCQFQSQRVSLILKFSRMCEANCQGVFGIIITLIDQDKIIHDYEQITYTTTYQCEHKFFIYLLYKSRPKDMTKTYNIQIDAYNKINMSYHASWILPVKFLFLPVNKISAHLTIPVDAVSFVNNCPIFCGHGQCLTYVNNRSQYFCHCNSGWSGVNCTISYKCDCSLDSICLDHMNNRSICLCSLRKYGQRCRLPSICQKELCKNNGLCIPDDQRISINSFQCLCPSKFAGQTCEIFESTIHISFHQIEIPRSLLVHFITLQTRADPLATTISMKIPYDQDIAMIHTSILFHIIIVQISNEYFLVHVKMNYDSSLITKIEINLEQRCPHIQELFHNKTILSYPLLGRVKYYHLLCKNLSQLKWFHDNEQFICLCNDEQYANCFLFDFKPTYTCKGLGDCQNDGQCFTDSSNCLRSIFCVCKDCFYGSKCQFTTKGFGLSLDAIFGYQIRPNLPINRQPIIVIISIALTTIILVIGLINSSFSIMTFQRKQSNESGCRYYLLTTSIVSLCTTIIFSIKFLMLILSQISFIKNEMILQISCISTDFLLRLCPIIVDCLNASVAIDRALTVIMSTKFNKNKSKRAVRWVIIGIFLVNVLSILHDPLNRQLIYDEAEQRRWCLVQYSSSLEIYNSIIIIIHFFIPFLINILTSIIIIVFAARKSFKARKQETYLDHLKKQFRLHKHLLISSIFLVLLATPRLIISFTAGCMKSIRNPSFYLASYFISFIPPSLTFIVFVIPSSSYKKEFYIAINRFRMHVLRTFHIV